MFQMYHLTEEFLSPFMLVLTWLCQFFLIVFWGVYYSVARWQIMVSCFNALVCNIFWFLNGLFPIFKSLISTLNINSVSSMNVPRSSHSLLLITPFFNHFYQRHSSPKKWSWCYVGTSVLQYKRDHFQLKLWPLEIHMHKARFQKTHSGKIKWIHMALDDALRFYEHFDHSYQRWLEISHLFTFE